MENNTLIETLQKNNISLVYEKDNINIKIPYDIFNKNNEEDIAIELENYKNYYIKCVNIRDNISNILLKALDTKQIDSLINDISDTKEYKYIEIIREYLNINNLEDRFMTVAVALGLNKESIEEIKQQIAAQHQHINNRVLKEISDENLDKIIDKIENVSYYRSHYIIKNRTIPDGSKPILLIEYNEYNPKNCRGYINGDELKKDKEIMKIHLKKQPLDDIFETENITNSWVKYIELDDSFSDEELSTIKAEACIRLKPSKFDKKDIPKNNTKWVDKETLKKEFKIEKGIGDKIIQEIYDNTKNYCKMGTTTYYNRRAFEEAKRIYHAKKSSIF